jgi:lysophospholipase L1-like esterase
MTLAVFCRDSTEDIKFINNKLISSLDPSLYSDGVHFSDAGKRNLVRIIKFHLNPYKQMVTISWLCGRKPE